MSEFFFHHHSMYCIQIHEIINFVNIFRGKMCTIVYPMCVHASIKQSLLRFQIKQVGIALCWHTLRQNQIRQIQLFLAFSAILRPTFVEVFPCCTISWMAQLIVHRFSLWLLPLCILCGSLRNNYCFQPQNQWKISQYLIRNALHVFYIFPSWICFTIHWAHISFGKFLVVKWYTITFVNMDWIIDK